MKQFVLNYRILHSDIGMGHFDIKTLPGDLQFLKIFWILF